MGSVDRLLRILTWSFLTAGLAAAFWSSHWPSELIEASFPGAQGVAIRGRFFVSGLVLMSIAALAAILFSRRAPTQPSPLLNLDSGYDLDTLRFHFGEEIRSMGLAVVALLLLLLFCNPFEMQSGLGSWGIYYGDRTLNPFSEPFGYRHRRIFVPWLAHGLGFTSREAYLGFNVLAWLILAYLTARTLFQHSIARAPDVRWIIDFAVETLILASVLSSSFYVYNLHFPGYVEVFFFIVLLLMISVKWPAAVIAALTGLCLLIHEASTFSLIPLALLIGRRRFQMSVFAVLGFYWLIGLTSFGFSPWALIHPQTDFLGKSSVAYLFSNLAAAFFSILVAYKLLWLIPIWAIRKQIPSSHRMAIGMMSSIVMFPLAVDTSRLMGFGFVFLLLLLRYLFRNGLLRTDSVKSLMFFALNLVLPSLSFLTYTSPLDHRYLRGGIWKKILQLLPLPGLRIA